jgi:hypothetical protein
MLTDKGCEVGIGIQGTDSGISSKRVVIVC